MWSRTNAEGLERTFFLDLMAVQLLTLAGGLALLMVAASGLVRGASALALRFGLSPLIVGLTVVAFGTSAPELVVSVQAALSGAGGIAVGNVVGSNIANIGLILGVAVLVRPFASDRSVLRQELPVLLGATALSGALLFDRVLSPMEGAVLVAGLVAYLAWSITVSRRKGRADLAPEAAALLLDGVKEPVWRQAAFVILGLGGLVLGADLFVGAATTLAEAAGVSNAVIGLTVVALGTSLPELATSTVAAWRGEGSIAIGNVIGSNLFNLLGILGVAALVRPLAAPGLNVVDVSVMLAFALILLPMMISGQRLVRAEGSLLVIGYAGYMMYLGSLHG